MKSLAIVAVVLALVGCSSASKSATAPTSPVGSTSATVQPTPSADLAPDLADVARCASLVDKKTADYVTETGGPHCITAADIADDSTGFSVVKCTDTHTRAPVVVYVWYSTKPVAAADTHEYLARADGYIEVMPDSSATNPAIVASVYVQAGCV